MTTLVDRPGTALLVVDMQREVVAQGFRRDEVIARIAALVERARAAGVPVVWVQHEDDELQHGSEGWGLVDALEPAPGEPVLRKRYGDAFEETGLERELAARGAGRLLVTGAQTDFCIRSTLHGALARGYDAILVADAHTTDDKDLGDARLGGAQVVAHTNAYWRRQRAPGRTGGVVDADEIDFAAFARRSG